MLSVATISVTPVKGFRLLHPTEVDLDQHGAAGNRRFLLVDRDGRRLRTSLTAWSVVVRGEYDADAETLRMTFPEGAEVEGSALGNGTVVADTLRLIKGYRGQLTGGEIPFGVYAWVERAGRVAVGDALEPL